MPAAPASCNSLSHSSGQLEPPHETAFPANLGQTSARLFDTFFLNTGLRTIKALIADQRGDAQNHTQSVTAAD